MGIYVFKIPDTSGNEIDSKQQQISSNSGKGVRRRRISTRYVCVCKKIYTTKQQMMDHVTSVHGGDRYVCTICLMKSKNPNRAWFSSKANLLRHCNRVEHDIEEITSPIHAAVYHADSEESQ